MTQRLKVYRRSSKSANRRGKNKYYRFLIRIEYLPNHLNPPQLSIPFSPSVSKDIFSTRMTSQIPCAFQNENKEIASVETRVWQDNDMLVENAPINRNSFFYAVILSLLLPLRESPLEFSQCYQLLFMQENAANESDIKKLKEILENYIKSFDEFDNTLLKPYQKIFKEKLEIFMEKNKDSIPSLSLLDATANFLGKNIFIFKQVNHDLEEHKLVLSRQSKAQESTNSDNLYLIFVKENYYQILIKNYKLPNRRSLTFCASVSQDIFKKNVATEEVLQISNNQPNSKKITGSKVWFFPSSSSSSSQHTQPVITDAINITVEAPAFSLRGGSTKLS